MSSPRVEQILRKILEFFIYSFLECAVIMWMYIIGLLSFLCSEFAKFFNLSPPCLLCTRIDHILVHKNSEFHYNESVCEGHKKDISSLAYCQVHSKLSDIKSMCDRCLLSFATEKDSDDVDTFKCILHKNIDGFVEEDHKILNCSDFVIAEKGSVIISCSCCGETLTRNTKKSDKYPSVSATALSNASISSPRAPTFALTDEEAHSVELCRKENGEKADKDVKDAMMPLLSDPEYLSEQGSKTPSFIKDNRFFKISLTDSGSPSSSPRFANPSSPRFANPSSPRYANRQARKIQLEKELLAETNDKNAANRAEVRLDRKSLIELYMELDEERNASAEAANNAMAMITRLQAEKSAMQMEALHYQRMMDEQAEYDREALKVMQDQVQVLEADLETYREKYGPLEKEDFEEYEVDGVEDYNDFKSEIDTDEK